MKFLIFIVSFVAILLPNIEAQSYGEGLIARLNSDVRDMNGLIATIQQHYRSHQPYPRNYDSNLRRASATIGRALELMESIERPRRRYVDQVDVRNLRSIDQERDSREYSSRRSNNDELQWKTNFYKALSRALKDEFKDEQMIQENIQDGFVLPTQLRKRGRM